MTYLSRKGAINQRISKTRFFYFIFHVWTYRISPVLTFLKDPEEIRYQLGGVSWYDESLYQPSYNVAPSHFQPVILHKNAASDIEKIYERESKTKSEKVLTDEYEVVELKYQDPSVEKNQKGLADIHLLESMKWLSDSSKVKSMRWGLVPSWVASGTNKNVMNVVNIRDDSLTIHNKPMFKNLKSRNRCLVVAQGFYEWKRSGSGKNATKVPFYTHLANKEVDKIMLMGALYDKCKVKGEFVFSYAVVTTSANKVFSSIHDRMPLMFDPIEDRQEIMNWLSPVTPFNDTIKDILHPSELELSTYEVLSLVNSTKNNSSDFIIPLSAKQDKSTIQPTILNAFFEKSSSVPEKKRKNEKSFSASVEKKVKRETKKEPIDQDVISLVDSD